MLVRQNSCSSNPCFHNATCLNGFTDKKYICVCQFGYIGEKCEKGKTTYNSVTTPQPPPPTQNSK